MFPTYREVAAVPPLGQKNGRGLISGREIDLPYRILRWDTISLE